jgi:hypothetical protein
MWFFIFVVSFVVVTLLLAYLRFWSRGKTPPPHEARERHQLLTPLHPKPPSSSPKVGASSSSTSGQKSVYPYHWGRYKQPFEVPTDITARSFFGAFSGKDTFGWIRLKRWSFLSLSNEKWLVGMVLADLGYIANVWVYLMDKDNPPSPAKPPSAWEYRALAPLSKGLSFEMSQSSGEGVIEWDDKKGNQITFVSHSDSTVVNLNVDIDGHRLVGRVVIERPAQSLALLFPLQGLNDDRAAYTHKACGMKVVGKLKWGNDLVIDFSDEERSFATMDWTRSFARRVTQWKWACFAGRSKRKEGKVHRLGLNLSADVYEDKENALWLDDEVYPLGPVDFVIPNDKNKVTTDPWKFKTQVLDLEFTPITARKENIDLLIIRSDFIQLGGVFRGKINVANLKKEEGSEKGEEEEEEENVIELDDILGVVETHYSLW